MKERIHDCALIEKDFSARAVDRRCCRPRLCRHPLIDLTMRGAAEVKPFRAVTLAIFQGKGARCHALCAQSLHIPARRHLFRDDTIEIVLDKDIIDNGKPRPL